MNAPTKCVIYNNKICNCVTLSDDIPAGGGIGILGASGSNLIKRNDCYANNINVSWGVYNTYWGNLNGTPKAFQNISVPPIANFYEN